eukprot:scaffold263579_cov35-Attheya_sp.AAC.1
MNPISSSSTTSVVGDAHPVACKRVFVSRSGVSLVGPQDVTNSECNSTSSLSRTGGASHTALLFNF